MVVPAGLAFMGIVTLTLAIAAIRARARRGAVQALIAALLTGVQAAILCRAPRQEVSALGFGLLLSAVGGRMVAAFTSNHPARSPVQARRLLWARRLGLLSAAALSLVLALDLSGSGEAGFAVRLLLLSSAAEAARLPVRSMRSPPAPWRGGPRAFTRGLPMSSASVFSGFRPRSGCSGRSSPLQGRWPRDCGA